MCALTLYRNAGIGTESEAVLHGAEHLDEVRRLVRYEHVFGLPPRLEREGVVGLCRVSRVACYERGRHAAAVIKKQCVVRTAA